MFGGAYAAAHYLPVTWAVDVLLIAGTAGEAGQVLADLYEAYLEVKAVTHESELDPAAKKLAKLIVEASESGALGLIFHFGGKALPKGKKTETPPATKKDYDVSSHIVNHDTCFVAGTPVLTPDGEQDIATFKPGDQILSRPENAPEHPVKTSIVEEVFELASRIMELGVGGQVIGTTEEHPFFVAGKGWVPAGELEAGDQLLGHDDQLTAVESVTKSGRYETVYNLRVKQDRTYFVGKQSWGFSIWVHNTYTVKDLKDGTWQILDDSGNPIPGVFSEKKAKQLIEEFNKAPELRKGLTDAEIEKYFKNTGVKTNSDNVDEIVELFTDSTGSKKTNVKIGGNVTLNKINVEDARKIQKFADEYQVEVTIVGSRVNAGKELKPGKSDWDYVINKIDGIEPTRKLRDLKKKAGFLLPKGRPRPDQYGNIRRGSDIEFFEPIDSDLPYVKFRPNGF
ncbi:polymorphic toxin-type HINT domain-containing protein [Gimesia fumaroli]|uniref:Hint domain-containing protein n=1 Tax=Gimesia fumaroli TaxID=2527976 RepID=A0A518IE44_9PLAN|nr:polymorphic toxin-type HINT domain-containing protein [Gimesia fumaroli]QDV51345.1 hypothetical protein Enr17x_34010 [Gimesia fumaroli]